MDVFALANLYRRLSNWIICRLQRQARSVQNINKSTISLRRATAERRTQDDEDSGYEAEDEREEHSPGLRGRGPVENPPEDNGNERDGDEEESRNKKDANEEGGGNEEDNSDYDSGSRDEHEDGEGAGDEDEGYLADTEA